MKGRKVSKVSPIAVAVLREVVTQCRCRGLSRIVVAGAVHHESICLRALYTPHSTLCTLHSTLYTPHSTLHSAHFALYTLHATLRTLPSTLITLIRLHTHVHTLHSTHYTPHSTFHIPHSTLHMLHSTCYTPHATLHTPHHSTRDSLGTGRIHNTAVVITCFERGYVMCVRVRGLEQVFCSLLPFPAHVHTRS